MRRILKQTIIAVAMIITTAAMSSAQTDGFNYQAVVRNAQGELVSNSSVSLRITLTDQTGAQVMYQETQTAETNAYGVLSVTVGAGVPASGQTIDSVDWAGGNVWMRVEIDAAGGTSYTDMGLTKLQSVPYAYFAANGNGSGDRGPQGPKGDKGDKGDQGETGAQGPKGDKGDKGDPGTGLTNGGGWTAGTTYNIGDYVFAPSSSNPQVNTMWIAQSNGISGSTQPKDDAANWVEFTAPAGQDGTGIANVTKADDGSVTFIMTNGQAYTFNLKGDKGEQGQQGAQGLQGVKGDKGDRGEAGAQGPKGDKGDKGDPGTGLTNGGGWTAGTTYNIGDYVFAPSSSNPQVNTMWIAQSNGISGSTQPKDDAANWVEFQAPAGEQGAGVADVAKADDGSVTFTMTNGQSYTFNLKGERGERGEQGVQGVQGQTGPQGPKGDQGDKGDQGETGPQGPKGDKGDKGDAGTGLTNRGSWTSGTEYSVGDYVFAPSKENDNINSMWIAQNAVASATQPKDDATNWVEFQAPAGHDGVGVAGMTKDDAGNMTITMTNDQTYVFNFKGDKGDKGEQGLQGEQGPAGPQGQAGEKGEPGAKGDKGDPGETGAQGPKGDKGDKGEPGTGLTNRGSWTSGAQYSVGDYVFAPSADNNSVNSMWIAQNAVTSTTQPKNDATNWVEFKAPAGADGQNGVGIASVTSADGNVTITMTDNTSKTFYMKGDRGEQGEQGNPGRDGMQVQGSEGQTLVHNGTTWVATDQLSLNKLDVKPATTTEDALFEVKDKDGNVVFAVYPDGVHVYVDADATKAARRTGFVVTGRSGTKDGEEQDYFAINADGTKVFVDDDASKAARRTGFVVTGRSGTKDGENTNFLTINDEGTKVFVDDDESKAARRTGFVVTGRSGTKDGENTNFLTINDEGTKVFVDDDENKAARRTGFVVTGRSGTKDGENTNFFTINDEGTKVFVDDDENKAVRRSGFVVTGRSGTKEGETNDLLSVNDEGTKVFVDDDENKAARRTGFVVTGRSGTKDGENTNFFTINDEGTKVFVDDDESKAARRTGFVVTGRSGTKEGETNDLLSVNDEGTKVFVDDDENKAARRTGFVVTGRSGTKDGDNPNFLTINDEGTKVFIDDELDNGKAARRTGFVVTGRSGTKEDNTNYLKVATDGTLVNFDDNNDSKAARRTGFIVTGRSGTKDGGVEQYMTINTDSTRFYINGGSGTKGNFGVDGLEGDSKADSGNGGFAVSGRGGSKGNGNGNLFNIDLTTTAKTLNGENRIYWYPAEEKNAFMAGNLLVEHPDSVGKNSFNAGYQNKAIGNYSQALGYKSVAKGETSMAIGNQARATGKSSFSFGEQTTSIGESSVAIGRKANSALKNAYALGDSAQAKGTGSYAFGAGAVAGGTSSFAFGSVGQDSAGRPLNAPNASADFAYAIGAGTASSGKGALATGVGTKASGDYSTAMGYFSQATGYGSLAIGYSFLKKDATLGSGAIRDNYTLASGKYSTAIGFATTSSGEGSIAMGLFTTASANHSIAIGREAEAIGSYSMAFGYSSKAEGTGSTAIGGSYAKGQYSTAIGEGAIANSHREIAIGSYNTEYTPESTWAWKENDRLFVIGNGSGKRIQEVIDNGDGTGTLGWVNRRSDALIVYKNGNTTINGTLSASNISTTGTISGGAISGSSLSTSGNLTVSGEVTSSLIPNPIGYGVSRDLGSQDNLWNNVYAQTLRGTYLYVSGNVRTSLLPWSYENLGSEANPWNFLYARTLEISTSAEIDGTLTAKRVRATTSGISATNTQTSGTFTSTGYNYTSAVTLGGKKYMNTVGCGIYTSASSDGTSSAGATNFGIYAYASGNGNNSNKLNKNYAIYAKAASSSYADCYAGYFEGTIKAVYDYSGHTAHFENNGSSETCTALYAESSGWAGYFEGDVYLKNNYQSSDSRLKKDVQTIDGALGKVLKLRGVSFYWKNKAELGADSTYAHNDTKKHIGVIAQEIEQEFPELVKTDASGYKTVEYSSIAPILIEAVKELKAEKDELQAEKDALEAKVEKLEAQMKEILEKLK